MSGAIQDATACREALARLPELDLSALRQQWRAPYKTDASPHLSRELSRTEYKRSLSAVSAGSGSANSGKSDRNSRKPERSGGVLVPN
jgi:hypothetical protein